MDNINKNYFLGKMQFLPIHTQKLQWEVAASMLKGRRRLVVLPPTGSNHLGLLLAGHKPKSELMTRIRDLTDWTHDAQHIVSIWLPVLSDRSSNTIILYGLGQLHTIGEDDPIEHLNNLKSKCKEGQNPTSVAFHAIRA